MALSALIYNKFRDAFKQKCFRLIIEAYKTSLAEEIIQVDWKENDISSEIHKHLEINQLRLKWKISSNIEAHLPKDVPKVRGFADKFPRIDFRLTSFISNFEYDYFFEAKILKQNNHALKRRYIDTGINNFVSQKYENGSLIGYLVEGKTNETVQGINSLLEYDERNSEILNLKSNKLLKTVYESFHSNIGTLTHLIFDFTGVGNC